MGRQPSLYALRKPISASSKNERLLHLSFKFAHFFWFNLQGSPSTCIVDTALIPLPSFLLVVFGAIILSRRSHDCIRIVIPRWIHILYMTLTIATIAMTILVLTRNTTDHLGVGLIPMVLIGLIFVFLGLGYEFKGRSRSLSAASDFIQYDSA